MATGRKSVASVYVALVSVLLWARSSSGDNPEARPGELQDFCQFEQFEAHCEPGEAVVIEEARYGRERYSRCISRDYGYLGCFSDVRALADARCSGRPSCTVAVPDKVFDAHSNCENDLKKYLSARYKCVKVFVPNVPKCRHTQTPSLTAPSGYISSYVANETGCGMSSAPWQVTLHPGQMINLTLLDFSSGVLDANNSTRNRLSEGHCRVLATIKDPLDPNFKSHSVCGRPGVREQHVLLTRGHEVEIRIMQNPPNFLLRYEAVGCPDLIPDQAGRWFRRSESDPSSAEAGCRQDGSKWTLTCKGYEWSGQIQNCSGPIIGGTRDQNGIIKNSSAFLIVVGIAVVIGFFILAIGIVIIKRQRFTSSASGRSAHSSGPGQPKDLSYLPRDPQGQAQYTVHPPLLVHDSPTSADENEYAYVEEYQAISPVHHHAKVASTHASGGGPPPPPPCAQHPSYATHVPNQAGYDVQRGSPATAVMAAPPSDYNSLEESVYRLGPGYMSSNSPGGGTGRNHPYHVLDLKDGHSKRDNNTDMV